MCLYPKLIKNPKYKSTKKNRGNIPVMKDPRTQYVPIGCQNCMECKKKKAREWNLRLQEDIKHTKHCQFITLTFNNHYYKLLRRYVKIYTTKTTSEYIIDNQIATIALRKFLERWRKKYKKSLRHWAITELGHAGTEHIHIHALVWTTHVQEITPIWKYGYVWDGTFKQGNKIKRLNYVNAKTINYITKYVTKIDFQHRSYKPIILTSPGIGKNFTQSYNAKTNTFAGKSTIETYKTQTGHNISIPIYWRNKLYTEEQREQLWLYKLDKEQRWIMGEKISIKNQNYKEYDATLKYYQKLNRQLGYDSDEIKWEQQQYEQERRALINNKRLRQWPRVRPQTNST